MLQEQQIRIDPLREALFVAYGQLKAGHQAESAEQLSRLAELTDPKRTVHTALWIWAVGEYSNDTGDGSLFEAHLPRIEAGIQQIAAHWKEETPHWLRQDRKGRFLSNLAIYYGALLAIQGRMRSDLAQRTGKEIRQAAFADYMRGDQFVSEQGTAEVWGDIGAAAVPFGMITAGDLALVSAVAKLDDARIAGEEAALLAWYFSESGQSGRARRWMGQLEAEQLTALGSIARLQVEKGGVPGGIRFIHDPTGGGNPYRQSFNERTPRRVTRGSEVTIRTYAEPFNPAQVVMLDHEVDGAKRDSIVMLAAQSAEGEPYWEAGIGTFEANQRVSYAFRTEVNSERVQSESYGFSVLHWVKTSRSAMMRIGDRSQVIYTSEGDEGLEWALTLQGDGASGSVAYSLAKVESGLDKAADVDVTWEDSALPHIELLTDGAGNLHQVRLDYKLSDDERLFGMGERFERTEFRGCEVDCYVYNQYKDQGMRTYMPVPFLLSSAGYGWYLQSDLYAVFRCGSVQADTLQIEADLHPERQMLAWHQFKGKPLQLIEQFTEITGKPKLPPKWAFGPWMSSNNWDSEQEVDYQLTMTAKYEIPSTVMVIEQWSDEASFYIFNDAQYEGKTGKERFRYDDFTYPAWGRWPDPRKMVERIHDQGLKVLLWQAPVMKFMEGIAHAQRDRDEAEMIASGYAVKRRDGSLYRIPSYEWFRDSLIPDFTNPEAAAWWLGKRQYLLDEVKIDGIKTDGGECVYGEDTVFHDGRDGREMRNAYPNSYIGAFHTFVNAHVTGGGITFSRSGYTGAQQMPMHWAGDEKSTFEAFRSTLMAGLGSGMAGIPFWGWDLGGFSGGIPTAELYIRSAEMAAFCPVMQYHAESRAEFNQDRTPWNIAERHGRDDVLTLYKKYADLRMNLLPYIYEQAERSAATGHPLMRAMWLDFPDDPNCLLLNMQYMFGERLLVAPVVHEGAASVKLYLPDGDWLQLFTGERYVGGREVTVPAPLGEIPVFLRADSVIPLNLDEQNQFPSFVGNAYDKYTKLTFMAYVTGSVQYEFRDVHEGYRIRMTAEMQTGRIQGEVRVEGPGAISLICRGPDHGDYRLTLTPGVHVLDIDKNQAE